MSSLHAGSGFALGDHVCCTYACEDVRSAVATNFLTDGLERNERLFFVAPQPEERFASEVAFPSSDVATLRKEGRLVFATTHDAYLPGDHFDAGVRLDAYAALVRAALDDGFSGVRVAADATAVILRPDLHAAFMSYELRAGVLATRLPFAALCLYDTRVCDEEALEALHMVHPHRVARRGSCDLPFEVVPRGDRIVIAGEIDLAGAPVVERLLVDVGSDLPELRLDLSGLTFIDVAGARALVTAAQAFGRRATVEAASPSVLRVWDVLGWKSLDLCDPQSR